MKNKRVRVTIAALAVTMIAGVIVGCDKKEEKKTSGDNKVTGSIQISGSSAMGEFVEKSAADFKAKNPDANISVQSNGSGTGLTQVLQGNVDIANSDIFANEKLTEDQAKELQDHQVLAEGFAIVTNKDVAVKTLKKDEIKKIFSGEIKNWKDVGGPDEDITLVHRPSSSGTRATFIKTILDGKKELENDKIGITQDNNGSVRTALEKTKGAVSYVALSAVVSEEAKKALNVLEIDGVSSSKENISTGKYPFWSWGHMYTKGEAKDLSKAFIEFIKSDANKQNLEKFGFVSGAEMKVK
ncbi:phosphate ABC transporter substrate-binding protein, PhoT family (TC 3.A.1.7.1) [Clostridium cavendishii DSM 21758]|uniref:Phosphate-binding protein n=1 Tax=Clostridium cavendishii DSM 21758 TaxID=1121302 RepID=A0A1M6KCD9_9CLOT|nr:phosphate ABC transporter substrate-binding protein [Clostridium cavendishii]SHJ56580.1 phosphate ABC transporter substrate-binding protein, PhoT family (TC 3.A.1.7.1) [Clostridium cavendishii DSM 21758]